jgi:carboxymethylenebutenolidase
MNKTLILALGCCLLAAAPTMLAQDWAKTQLGKSPRHLEWVTVKNGSREVKCFVAYPEVKNKATVVLVIHEIFGMTDWVESVADQLAEAGYIAIAPDLLSGAAPGGGGTAELGGGDAVRKAISSLPPDQITGDLKAAAAYATHLPAANGKLAVAGFCWGGSETFRFATNERDLKAAFVFYGTGPTKEADLERITAPVYGFYGENDARVGATIEKSSELMKKLKKTYEPVTYSGAGHGFMRAGQAPDGNAANKKAQEDAWKRWKELLSKI